MLMYLVLRLAAFLVRHLPERWGIAVARWLGGVAYRLSPLAKTGRDNFRHVLGPDADPARVSQLARQAFQSRLLNYYDLFHLSDMPLDEISRRVVFEGMEHLDQIVKAKRGAVVVTGHIGPMEFMIQAVAALGYPLIGVTEHLKPERLHQYVMSLRTVQGLDLISTQGSLLQVYRRIKRGDVLISAVDRDSTGTGVVIDFFDAPAWMPDGYARLAVQANVPVILGCCRRAGNGLATKIFLPLYPDQSLGKEAAVMDLTQRTVRLLEEGIREVPHEWHLSTPVWRLAQEKLEQEAPK